MARPYEKLDLLLFDCYEELPCEVPYLEPYILAY